MSTVLVVDDDAAIRTVVAQALRRSGYDVTVADSLGQLERALAVAIPDVLITDVVLPDGDGIDHVRNVAERHPTLPIIVLSAQNTLTTAVRAAEVGAYEYLPKPFDLDVLSRAVTGALARGGVLSDDRIGDEDRALPLIGRSAAMQDVYRVIARVISNDLTVLISGESGTGKELVARAIHDLGQRSAAPFIAINMAAIPRELIEAELFGHERGAFTGAATRNAGRFEQATGGTLFLDEIGDMPMEAQTRLLRVLQSGEFTSVGGARTIRVDVRILAATNRDLAAQVAAGHFREDLFYRLNVVPVTLPPLRERRQDVALLARHFLDHAAIQGLPRRQLAGDAITVLGAYDWPGNVRELENLMRRLAVLARDEIIGADAIHAMLGARMPTSTATDLDIAGAVKALIGRIERENPAALDDGSLYDRVIGEVERPLIELMLARHGQNQLRAARAMGINRNTLRKRLDTLGIDISGDMTEMDAAGLR
ncbi:MULTISPECIES: nitrogen regulation protein NR(I) [unclassified Sphingomonas]|uniref:nitrogen regulation protein NR(I) n=1 Tax=unclassified Sphingomonas TaxID=196159 RepID=UPI0006F911EA|nr:MULTISPECIES: nitrogen regulation protein NR(I) [unclassified Sphingomonas]KQM91940.1 nitrogen regulation protein NR(I) [Sphingomonas sp. Leaf226]MDY0966864.1 nitrogen regulation protein NR(I) [Sphingomonas sp. CFBP9021]